METKVCQQCKEDKPLEQYSKCSKFEDGKQKACKACNKLNNAKFRKKRPQYQNQYYKTEIGKANKIKALNKSWDSLGAGIYVIVNTKTGSVYVGESHQLNRRKLEWSSWINNKFYQYMNSDFIAEIEKYGTDCWEWKVVEVLENPQKKTLLRKEREYIQLFSLTNKVLNKLNVG